MKTKPFWQSKELLVVAAGLLNTILGYFGLPSFELTPIFVTSLLVVLGVLRTWFTKAGVRLSI